MKKQQKSKNNSRWRTKKEALTHLLLLLLSIIWEKRKIGLKARGLEEELATKKNISLSFAHNPLMLCWCECSLKAKIKKHKTHVPVLCLTLAMICKKLQLSKCLVHHHDGLLQTFDFRVFANNVRECLRRPYGYWWNVFRSRCHLHFDLRGNHRTDPSLPEFFVAPA